MVDVFHASLVSQDRERKLNAFCTPESTIRLLIASSAFGMGIDIDDIKYVVLWEAPSSVSQIWQQIGRAGRNGAPSEARLLFSPQGTAGARTDTNIKELVKATNITCIRKQILRSVIYKVDKVPEVETHPARCCVLQN